MKSKEKERKNFEAIILSNPPRLVFGLESLNQFITDYRELGHKRLLLISIPVIVEQITKELEALQSFGVTIKINTEIRGEPSFNDFNKILSEARSFEADSVIGVGGGSVMDVAKLIAAQLRNIQSTDEVVGINNLRERSTYLACIPTTSGTGSEVSPNAIFVNEHNAKVGVVSKFLVPDGAYVDPLLTISLPSDITAGTGIDALTHCLEAFTNKNSHPIIDLIALKGIENIAKYLEIACKNGNNLEARTNVALGSLYGGMCLGPVNTAAVHALSYPLSAEFHIPHGLSNALLLPFVMDFNLSANPERYAQIALALGAKPRNSHVETAKSGVAIIQDLIQKCDLPSSLEEMDVPFEAIGRMADGALRVQRLLKNNIRDVSLENATNIYKAAYKKRV